MLLYFDWGGHCGSGTDQSGVPIGVRSVCLLLSKPSLIIQEKACPRNPSQSRAIPYPEREYRGMKVVEEDRGGEDNDRCDVNDT